MLPGMANWPFVQRTRNGWRGWFTLEGERRFLPQRATVREASEEAQAIRRAQRAGGAFSGITIGQLAERFLEDVRRVRTFGTWRFYHQQLEGAFGAIRRDTLLALVTPADMRHLITVHQAGKYSAQTIQHRRAVLRRMFRWAKRQGLSSADPTEIVDWPPVHASAFDVLTGDEMRDVLQQLRAVPADYDLILVAVYTGLRRAELARLRVADVDQAADVLWVRGKVRNEPVPIVDEIRPSLLAMVERAPSDFLLAESAADRGPKKMKAALTADELAEVRRTYTVANLSLIHI